MELEQWRQLAIVTDQTAIALRILASYNGLELAVELG